MDMYQFLSIDLPPLLTAIFCSLSCALVGNFLLLRKMSLVGDSISHSVLPGIVIAFLLSGTRSSIPIFIGALIFAGISVLLVEVVKKLGKVESGAAMGVVFSLMFASGVFLIEQASARVVDLDADCVLHGQLETIFWFPPKVFSFLSLLNLPYEVFASLLVFCLISILVFIFYKELTLLSFDKELADALGFKPAILNTGFLIIVAASIVISFKAVGTILVIAMLICPPATARLLTDKLKTQIFLSLFFAVLTAIFGYFIAVFLPSFFNLSAVNIAGSISVSSGIFLTLAIFFAPQYGIIGKIKKTKKFAHKVIAEDILGFLFRVSEVSEESTDKLLTKKQLLVPFKGVKIVEKSLANLLKIGDVLKVKNSDGFEFYSLSETGQLRAKNLVRTHRLWEQYLVDEVGVKEDHVHDTAMDLEHFTDEILEDGLAKSVGAKKQDPHGRDIPEKD